MDKKSLTRLEYDVEDLWGVNWCKVDIKEALATVEYDEFLVSVGDLLRAIQSGGRFKVTSVK